MTIDAFPEWGLLLHADATAVRRTLDAVAWPSWITPARGPDEFMVVEGTRGWTGVFCTWRNRPLWALADAFIKAGYEIVSLDYSVDESYFAERWNGRKWEGFDEEPNDVATRLGVVVPWPAPPTPRPVRAAALVEGLERSVVRTRLPDHELLEIERGLLILDPPYTSDWKLGARRVYRVRHYLEDNDFNCVVTFEDGSIGEFPGPPTPGLGWKHLPDIDGETDPRTIVRKLGIPEGYMFPPTRK